MTDGGIEEWVQSKGCEMVRVAALDGHVNVWVDRALAPNESAIEALASHLRAGGHAEVVVAGGGGRHGIGRVLVHRGLLRRELRTLDVDHPVPARWVRADQDEAIREWASGLGIAVEP